jgi:hypothetical protein
MDVGDKWSLIDSNWEDSGNRVTERHDFDHRVNSSPPSPVSQLHEYLIKLKIPAP